MTSYETLQVPVTGGALHVGSWGAGQTIAMAVHGLTLNHAEFHALGENLADCGRLLAPDLRGRGGSAGLPPPYGLGAHAEDIAVVLKHVGAPPVILIGHSWGAVVALVVAQRHPELVSSVLLIDGGLPPERGLAGAEAANRSRERVLERLDKSFRSVEAYLEPWRAHAGFRNHWNEYIERAFAYDVDGSSSQLRCTLRLDAFLADLQSTYENGDGGEQALLTLRCGGVLVRAARNMADEDRPQYSDEAAAHWTGRVPGLDDVLIANENHYTVLLSASGAEAVASLVRDKLRRSGSK